MLADVRGFTLSIVLAVLIARNRAPIVVVVVIMLATGTELGREIYACRIRLAVTVAVCRSHGWIAEVSVS